MRTLVEGGLISSNSEARRLFDSGAITDMTENKKSDVKDEAKLSHVYKVGKHKFVRII